MQFKGVRLRDFLVNLNWSMTISVKLGPMIAKAKNLKIALFSTTVYVETSRSTTPTTLAISNIGTSTTPARAWQVMMCLLVFIFSICLSGYFWETILIYLYSLKQVRAFSKVINSVRVHLCLKISIALHFGRYR